MQAQLPEATVRAHGYSSYAFSTHVASVEGRGYWGLRGVILVFARFGWMGCVDVHDCGCCGRGLCRKGVLVFCR